MSRSPLPQPATLPLGTALDRSESLGSLMRRVQESNARYAAVRPLLPAGLASLVRPGPIDDTSWALLVPSGAAAAKLRQCLPTIAAALHSQGWTDVSIRVKVVALASVA